jgi:signal transduction histidine kinase
MKQVAAISSAGWHLLQLVEGVMDLSRIEQDEIRQSLAQLDPLPVARAAVDALRPAIAGRHVALSLESPTRPLPQVRGDADILQRILTHLLSNAVKYNRDGGSVHLSFAVSDSELGIVVRDTGIGIPAALQSRLFTPFDRLGHENSTTLGTGIGLTICRRLAELTDCRISFESTEGQGSTFTLHIPRA